MEQYITISNGEIENHKAFEKFLSLHKDGRYLWISEKKNKRSLPQNAYIHAVLFPELAAALVEAGYEGVTSEMAKEIAKKRFLTVQLVNPDTGEMIEYVRHTAELSTIELNEFIEAVIRFAAESLNYEIPYPNEQTRINA